MGGSVEKRGKSWPEVARVTVGIGMLGLAIIETVVNQGFNWLGMLALGAAVLLLLI